jgi:hypothetical protein
MTDAFHSIRRQNSGDNRLAFLRIRSNCVIGPDLFVKPGWSGVNLVRCHWLVKCTRDMQATEGKCRFLKALSQLPQLTVSEIFSRSSLVKSPEYLSRLRLDSRKRRHYHLAKPLQCFEVFGVVALPLRFNCNRILDNPILNNTTPSPELTARSLAFLV